MGRGGGEERGVEGREGRVRRRHRRQLCERVQCVRERVSEKVSAAPTSREEGPRGGPGLGFRGRPPATPSFPASGGSLPISFPPPVLSGLPTPARSYLAPPPLGTHLPFPCAHLRPPDPESPATPNPLYPPAPTPSFFSWGQTGGMGGAEPRRRRERGPGRSDNS